MSSKLVYVAKVSLIYLMKCEFGGTVKMPPLDNKVSWVQKCATRISKGHNLETAGNYRKTKTWHSLKGYF